MKYYTVLLIVTTLSVSAHSSAAENKFIGMEVSQSFVAALRTGPSISSPATGRVKTAVDFGKIFTLMESALFSDRCSKGFMKVLNWNQNLDCNACNTVDFKVSVPFTCPTSLNGSPVLTVELTGTLASDPDKKSEIVPTGIFQPYDIIIDEMKSTQLFLK